MQRPPPRHAFTLIEMITVIAIIAILSGLVLGVAGLVQNKGVRAKAEAEIKMLSTAMESYKTDFGGYPQTTATDSIDAVEERKSGSPTSTRYKMASLDLYKALSGDENANGKIDASGSSPEKATNYVPDFFRASRFDPAAATAMKQGSSVTISYLVDPFGYCYGYSTAGLLVEQTFRQLLATDDNASRKDAESKAKVKGLNPTFDLWSTGGTTTTSEKDLGKWIKNW